MPTNYRYPDKKDFESAMPASISDVDEASLYRESMDTNIHVPNKSLSMMSRIATEDSSFSQFVDSRKPSKQNVDPNVWKLAADDSLYGKGK
jgi:hypothetical protein